mmetsp:Transcript_31199/g.85553  ORF Transcript_31199/g.85553 Transcript_31199/m.85553 type:complete len:304 (-) Transcript_31199:1978-2889(-)
MLFSHRSASSKRLNDCRIVSRSTGEARPKSLRMSELDISRKWRTPFTFRCRTFLLISGLRPRHRTNAASSSSLHSIGDRNGRLCCAGGCLTSAAFFMLAALPPTPKAALLCLSACASRAAEASVAPTPPPISASCRASTSGVHTASVGSDMYLRTLLTEREVAEALPGCSSGIAEDTSSMVARVLTDSSGEKDMRLFSSHRENSKRRSLVCADVASRARPSAEDVAAPQLRAPGAANHGVSPPSPLPAVGQSSPQMPPADTANTLASPKALAELCGACGRAVDDDAAVNRRSLPSLNCTCGVS